jgi:hypothetical protein
MNMMSAVPLPLSTPITGRYIYGAARTRRQPVQPGMADVPPSGIRLVFQTAATALELVVLPIRGVHVGAAPALPGLIELFVDGRLAQQESARDGWVLNIDAATGAATVDAADPQTLRFDGLPAGWKTIEIWLPHEETTALGALRSDAPLVPLRLSSEQAPDAGRAQRGEKIPAVAIATRRRAAGSPSP